MGDVGGRRWIGAIGGASGIDGAVVEISGSLGESFWLSTWGIREAARDWC